MLQQRENKGNQNDRTDCRLYRLPVQITIFYNIDAHCTQMYSGHQVVIELNMPALFI